MQWILAATKIIFTVKTFKQLPIIDVEIEYVDIKYFILENLCYTK